MTRASREQLRKTFTQVADLYDRVRPDYPRQMFGDLTEFAGTGPGCRVLEIGCGTGQATRPLAAQGCRITAVELGSEMATVARRNLADFPRVEIVVSAFEDWPLPPEPVDVVFSATAFDWVDPALRVPKAADCLRPAGTLATVATHHVAGGTESFFAEMQGYYERFDPSTPPGLRLRPAAVIPQDGTAELAASGRFGPAVHLRYERDLTYSTAHYLDLLRTYSGHRALGPAVRESLLERLGDLIDRKYGGSVTKRYLTELRLAQRIA